MINRRVSVLVAGMLVVASIRGAEPVTLPSEDSVQSQSLELERRTQPWCPGDCAMLVPFVAQYRRGAERLVFVGARHSVDPDSPTMRAVAAGFARVNPQVVILEGFPTAMGENPPPLVEEAHRHDAPGTDPDGYARSEAMLAASTALKRGIPFLGGEPTREEQNQVLKAKGFTDADIAFSWFLGSLSQALRASDSPDISAARLAEAYPRLAAALKLPPSQGGWSLEAPSLAEFRQRYKAMYGVDIVGDDKFPQRIDVGDPTRHGDQGRVDNMTRDRHLLGLIEQQLAARHSVLVVFGGSHWSTLSAALEKRLGKPEVTPFLP
jgi:hypothetical protein